MVSLFRKLCLSKESEWGAVGKWVALRDTPLACARNASFPFPGATKGGTFAGAGLFLKRDLCHHR